jgi:type IV secretion system protein VirD4
VIQLPREEQILLIESQPPVKCKKITYYNDKFFTTRLLPKIKIPHQEPYMPDYASLKAQKQADANEKK